MPRQEGVDATEEINDPCEEPSQVEQELTKLTKSMEHVERMQGHLEERLQFVRMPVPEDADSSEGMDKEVLAPLAAKIRAAQHRINCLSMRTESLLETLAI